MGKAWLLLLSLGCGRAGPLAALATPVEEPPVPEPIDWVTQAADIAAFGDFSCDGWPAGHTCVRRQLAGLAVTEAGDVLLLEGDWRTTCDTARWECHGERSRTVERWLPPADLRDTSE